MIELPTTATMGLAAFVYLAAVFIVVVDGQGMCYSPPESYSYSSQMNKLNALQWLCRHGCAMLCSPVAIAEYKMVYSCQRLKFFERII